MVINPQLIVKNQSYTCLEYWASWQKYQHLPHRRDMADGYVIVGKDCKYDWIGGGKSYFTKRCKWKVELSFQVYFLQHKA